MPNSLHASLERIWLIDSSIFVFRAWFIRNPLPKDTAGNPVNAVHGFLRFVYHLLNEQKPQQIAFAFDTSLQSSARKAIYPDYKANRSSAPDELKYQFKLCRDFLDALGLVQTASTAHEADDLIGTWATQQRTAERQIIIISGDKDLAQLLKAEDIWWDYNRRGALHAGGIKDSFGVWPEQIADQLAIAGDKADNIPGVPGVGMSTAAKLLKRFGSLDNILENLEQIGSMQVLGAKRLQQLVTQHQATIRLARQLTTINCQVPEVPNDLSRKAKDLDKLQELCTLLKLSTEQYELWVRV
ncbi:MAG TPA: 5'-3' exonuclease H3TH domain-containing protein [Thiolinea sp.]|nr:5'-3' exonuclease H3TH domain-containing protein [Thiolinea sp.]